MNPRVCVVFISTSAFLVAAACSSKPREVEPPTIQAQIARGKYLIRYYGCQACHEVPSVAGPQGSIGPSLQHTATKYYLAGELPNSPENLRLWIQRPHSINPQTLMPDLNVTDDDAADIALFLETLQ
jgi:cytochrome c